MLFYLLSFALADEISLNSALDKANQSAEVQIAEINVSSKNLDFLKALTNFGPKIQAEMSMMHFGEPVDVNLMGDQPMDCASLEQLGFGDLCQTMNEPLRVRDERIMDTKIQALFPISSLYAIDQGVISANIMKSVSEIEKDMKKGQVRLAATQAYLNVLQMKKTVELTNSMSKRLERRVNDLDAFVEQGLASSLNLSRLKDGLAEAKHAKSKAEYGLMMAKSHLVLYVGSFTGLKDLDFVDFKSVNFQRPSFPNSHREQRLARMKVHLADRARKLALSETIPQISLLAAMVNSQGQGDLTPANQKYIGVHVQGDFSWGSKLLNVKTASNNLKMAEKAAELQKFRIDLTIMQMIGDVELKYDALKLAEQKMNTAKEAHRQIGLKFEQKMLGVSDILDAESELLQSELGVISAQKDYVLSIASCQHALGQEVDPLKKLGVQE